MIMKKILALVLTVAMLLSCAAVLAEAVPSKTTSVTVADTPAKEDIQVETEANATPGLFVEETSEEAAAQATAVVEKMQQAEAVIDVYASETRQAIEAALSVEAASMTLVAEPVVLTVNESIAEQTQDAQLLTLVNVPVGEKFVVVLLLTTGDVTEEIVLTDVDSDAESMEVYAVIDVETLTKIRNADVVVVTVLSTVEAE